MSQSVFFEQYLIKKYPDCL